MNYKMKKDIKSHDDLSLFENFHESKSGILTDPSFNKGIGFTKIERKKLKIRGLLPTKIETLEEQVDRCCTQLRLYKSNIEKYIYLQTLLNTNEILFFRLLLDNLVECLP
jgi:malate dehydrogenase (oxaloacetate-decarboxylating)(NADP+)